jgi:hypothetical protein
LCLTIFSLISLSTASAGKSLTDEANRMVVGYYQADTLAEEVLAHIVTYGRFPESVLGVSIRAVEMEIADGEPYTYVTYACPANDRKDLVVELIFDSSGFRIVSWQLTNTIDWVPFNETGISERFGINFTSDNWSD